MSNNSQIVTDATLQEALTDAVRRHVGKGPGKVSVCSIATAIGHSDGFWQQVRAGKKTTSLLATGNLSVELGRDAGADLWNEVLAPFGFTGVRAIEASETCPIHVTGELANAIRLIAEALEDGNFDADERFAVATKLRALSNMADGLTETPKLRSVG